MAQHARLRIDTGLAVYFCDPQSPWQRGTNSGPTVAIYPRTPGRTTERQQVSRMKGEPSDGPGGTCRQALVGSLITAGAVLATLLMAELGLRTFAPVSDPCAREKVRSINRFIRTDHASHDSVKLDIDEGLPGVRPEGAFTTNNKGYRGPPLTCRSPRTSGGSTWWVAVP